MQKKSINQTIAQIKEYLSRAQNEGAEKVVVAGTQALREARNSQFFLKQLKEIVGVDCQIISSRQEGELTFKAVSKAFALPSQTIVFDIGGGSTEFILSKESQPVEAISLPLGSVRLSEAYLLADPPKKTEINHLRKAVRKELEKIKHFPSGFLYGVAGTVTTVVAVAHQLEPYNPDFVHGYYLKREEVEEVASYLASLPLVRRKKVKGLEPKRADVIVGGAFLLLEIIDFFSAQGLVVSEADLLDGLALSWKSFQPLPL